MSYSCLAGLRNHALKRAIQREVAGDELLHGGAILQLGDHTLDSRCVARTPLPAIEFGSEVSAIAPLAERMRDHLSRGAGYPFALWVVHCPAPICCGYATPLRQVAPPPLGRCPCHHVQAPPIGEYEAS